MHLLHSRNAAADIVQSQQLIHLGVNNEQYGCEHRTTIMAYASNTTIHQIGLVARFAALAECWRAESVRRKVYRTTLRELRNLTARDLADLGFDRSMITSLAYEAAYGK